MIGSRGFAQELVLAPSAGGPPVTVYGDLFRRGRNVDPGMDPDGGLVIDWVLLVPPGTSVNPLDQVLDPSTGQLFWVHGVPEHVRSLLRQRVDHVEAKLKTVYRVMTTVDILRDTDATDRNDLGDPIDTGGVIPDERVGVPASIVERYEVEPTDRDLRTVGQWVGWVPAGTDVRIGDRVRDTTEGFVYRVENITQPVQLALRELRLDLVRASEA